MLSRRDLMKQSATVAALLGATGMFPQYAFAAAFNQNAFAAKTINDAVKAYGSAAPEASTDHKGYAYLK